MENWHLEELGGAIDAFNRSLELKPKFYLALNARGVVNNIFGNIENARKDFYNAANQVRLLDAYIN